MQVVKYIDIPLQHISNLPLLAMNRPPREHTVALLERLRAAIPGLALRTTFICGFPGGCSMLWWISIVGGLVIECAP